MLGLHLRDEFLGQQMPGTAIALRAHDNTGAAQQSAEHILSITCPTADVLIALRAVSIQNTGRPVLLIGERGRGKSHIMAVMHHALASPEAVEAFRQTFGASRCKAATESWRRRFMPPVVMSHNRHHIVMGQRKWMAPGGFPTLCHGGMSLLEVAVPWIELEAL